MPRKYTPEQAINAFWSRVDKSGGDDACWNWLAARKMTGYGQMQWNGKIHSAHHISWMLTRGQIPNGLHVLHTCDNPSCVNPSHLWLGTNRDNSDDRERKGRGHDKRGERNGRCKISDVQVEEIRRRYAAGGVSQSKLASEYGLVQSYVGKIVTRKYRT